MVNFANIKTISIPEGNVKEISQNGITLWSASKLPSEYQEVEWIKSDGFAFLDLGISASGGIICDHEIMYNSDYISKSIDGGYAIGAHNTSYPYGRCGGYYKYGAGTWELGYGETFPGVSGQVSFDQKYHIVYCTFYDEAYLDVDGVRKITQSGQTVTTTNVYVFGTYWNVVNPPPSSYAVICRLYYAKIYKKIDGVITLVRDLVPCYRKSDKEIGMYDTLNKVFYTNIGTGSFKKGHNVPFTYTEVSYIQSDGNQYINAKLPNHPNGFRVEAKFSLQNRNVSNQFIYGAESGSPYYRNYFKYVSTSQLELGAYMYLPFNYSLQENTDYTIEVNTIRYTKSYVKINDTIAYQTNEYKNYERSSLTPYIFAYNANGGPSGNARIKLYYIKFYDENDNLLRDLIPVIIDDNVPCLYDKVSQQFFENAGTGSFTYE